MKRLLRVLGVLIIIVIAAIFLLPVIFKDEIIVRAQTEINENLNAKVEFSDISLSLFRSFPDFSLSIEDIKVDGTGNFEGVRLASLSEFRVDLNLMSVVSGSQFEVEQIRLADGDLRILIDTAGNANYDIAMASEEATDTAESQESAGFRLTLKKYALENIDLVYDDQDGNILVDIRNLNHQGRGDFTAEVVNLVTETQISALTVGYEGINYLSSVRAGMEADLVYSQNNGEVKFGDNLLIVNDLPLEFTGAVRLPEDRIAMNLEVKSPSEDLKKVLSLIPAVYVEGYEDMEATGTFSLTGKIEGDYDYADHYPSYDFRLLMQNGSFNYPDLPAGVDNINVNAHIFNSTTQLEGVEIEISEARASIAGNPLNMRLMLTNAMTNPIFDMALAAEMDLENLARVLPMAGYDLAGGISADFAFAGDMAAVEEERYGDLKASGRFVVKGIKVAGDSVPQEVRIQSATVAISPQYLDVQEFNTSLGKSDFHLKGRIDNILAYALNDDLLRGSFVMESDLIDLNELSETPEEAESAEEAADESDTTSLAVIRVPENLDLSFAATIRQLLYDNLVIKGLEGRMSLSKGEARMDDLTMSLLGGTVAMSGAYDSRPEKPEVDFRFNLKNFDIRESYQKFITIQKLAPIMSSSTGTFSTDLTFTSRLLQDMSPDLSSLKAAGNLRTTDLQTSPRVLQNLSRILANPRLSNLALNDLRLNYKVEDGRVKTEPFTLSTGSVRSTVSGSMGLDQSLDYEMDMSLPLKDIGAANILNQIGADPAQRVNMKVFITGTATEPRVKTSLKDMAGSIADQAVEQVKKKVEETVDDAKEKANEKAAELIAEAEKKGDQLITEAQKQADALVAEAENQAARIRAEANKQARKLEDEAKGNFLAEKGAKVAADKLRKEADEKATKLVNEARSRANKLVDEARQQKVRLVEEAREKGKIE